MSDTKTIGNLFAQLRELEEQKRDLNNQLKELSGQIAEVEANILDDMAENGVSMMEYNGYRYAPSTTTRPSSEDWDATFAWIRDNNAFYLVQKRLSAPAIKELIADGEEIPGVKLYEEPKLAKRKVRT